MRFASTLLIMCAAGLLSAADSIATWQYGQGTVAGAAAVPGSSIAADAVVTAADNLVRVTLAKAPDSHLILAPDSVIRIGERDGGILVTLEQGTLQANIRDKGPYADIHVEGAAIDVRVTGTLFVVERVKADSDYVALVEGKVHVNQRRDVAKALSVQDDGVDLTARQGVGGSTATGLTAVDVLAARPQLNSSRAAKKRSVRDQSLDGLGEWEDDLAFRFTTERLTDEITRSLLDQVRQEIAQQVTSEVAQQVTEQVTKQVIQETLGGVTPLGGPPGLPPR